MNKKKKIKLDRAIRKMLENERPPSCQICGGKTIWSVFVYDERTIECLECGGIYYEGQFFR